MKPRVYGLKCDNPACTWRDDTIPFEEYDKWLNRPCPLCGSNLLTQEDYDATKRLVKMTDSWLFKLIEKITMFFNPKYYTYDLGMDGSGKMKLTKVAEEDLEP